MHIYNKQNVLLMTFLLMWISPAFGVLLSLPQTPIFITSSTPSNIFLQLDDSGSMDWEMLMKPHWEMCAYDPKATGTYSSTTVCGNNKGGDEGVMGYANGGFYPFNYIFDSYDNVYSAVYNNHVGFCGEDFPDNAVGACPAGSIFDWRMYSSDINTVYYDPNQAYEPWSYQCKPGVDCKDAVFTMALSHPVQGQPGYTSTRNLSGSKYDVWIDNRGYSGSRPLRALLVNANAVPNGQVDLWDAHYTIQLSSTTAITITRVTYLPTALSIGAVTTVLGNLTGGSCYNILGPTSLVKSIFAGSYTWNSTGQPGCRTIAQAEQNFANWYQYSRRRSMASLGSISYLINNYPDMYYGINTINNGFFVPVPPAGTSDFTTYNKSLLSSLFNYQWEPQGTPNRSAVDRVGKYYSNYFSTNGNRIGSNVYNYANPITSGCQQNYTILITDGYWGDESINSSIGDEDGDGISQTLADVAYYYYKNNLQPSYPKNQVIPSGWDPATWLHMVTYTMAFGVVGNLTAGTNGWPTPALQINSNWGNPFIDKEAKTDDLWHTAFNTKGIFFGSQNPALAANSLGGILTNIIQRAGSAAPVAQNSSILNTGAQIFQALYSTYNWDGDILSYPIDLTGQLSATPMWSANCVLTGGACNKPVGTNPGIAATNRVIITRSWTGSNDGAAFRFPTNYTTLKVSGVYPANLTAFLAGAPYSLTTSNTTEQAVVQMYGTALTNYLRGDRTKEKQNGGVFRDRETLLGDIVDSSPIYVSPPSRIYSDTLEASPYSIFKNTYSTRIPMAFVGANDGMVHGFNATNGKEILAYIPGHSQIYQSLPMLSSPLYSHRYFANATPATGDVYVNGAWRTILAGALGNGGRGIYTLDITDPTNFTEAKAAQTFLWEFTHLDDPDIGYIQGTPIIAKIRTSATQTQWAVIVNNGYNSSGSGKPCLFIFLIGPGVTGPWVLGTNYYKLTVGADSTTAPNGLSTPFPVSVTGNITVDYVYAGDLKGNMWRFNLTDSTPSNWNGASQLIFAASQSTAGDQPITSAPVVGPHPNGLQYGVMVYFGTGRLLQTSDNTSVGQVTQSFYGIWDKLTNTTVNKSALVEQTILGSATTSFGTFRMVSSNPINWSTSPGPQNLGWYINLIQAGSSENNGERQISPPALRNNNVIFSTMVPSPTSCGLSGSSWIMEINASSGGAPSAPPFDVDNSGTFTSEDYITVTNAGKTYKLPPAGIQSTVGVTGTPAIFVTPSKLIEVKVTSGQGGLGTFSENPGTGPSGRQNWRQIQ